MALVAPPGMLARSRALNTFYSLGAAKAPAKTGKTPPAAKTKTAKAPPAKVDPMLTQAQAIAQLSIDPQATAINSAAAAAAADRKAQSDQYAGVMAAFGKLTAGDAEAARAAFAQGGAQVADYAKGLTGVLRTDQEGAAAADNAAIAKLAPGLPGVSNGAEANANVDYYLNGDLPANSLARHAADALLQLQGHRDSTGLALANDASAASFAATKNIGAIRQKLLDLEATRPGLIQSALSQLQAQKIQQRATDVQIGTLQLQTAKSAADQAIAYTNLTGTVHIVGKGGKVIDTGRLAAGSDAAHINEQATASAAATAGANERARLNALTQKETATIAAQARQAAAETTAQAKTTAAATAAAAKVTAAKVAAQNKQGKPATAAQRATIIKNAGAQGNALVATTRDRIWGLIPESAPQRVGEKPEDFAKRHASALTIYHNRLREHHAEIVSRVNNLIAGQLKLIGYTPDQITAQAEAIVTGAIGK